MRKILFIIPLFLLLVGCTSKVEDKKISYLEYKNNIEKQEEFINNDEELDFNTFFNISRDGDTVKYSLTINNPKKDMHDIKGMLINDYQEEGEYPTIGIFDNTKTLLVEHNNSIVLEGTIISSDDLGDVNFKLYLEYTDEEGKEEIYYDIQRG